MVPGIVIPDLLLNYYFCKLSIVPTLLDLSYKVPNGKNQGALVPSLRVIDFADSVCNIVQFCNS